MTLQDDICIEKFLADKMSLKEKIGFFKKLKSDKEFSRVFLFEKQLYEALYSRSWSFARNVDQMVLNQYKAVYKGHKIQKLKVLIKNIIVNECSIVENEIF